MISFEAVLKITGLTVVPDFGYFDDMLIRGNQMHRHFQMDVVHGYAKPFIETLDNNYVMNTFIETHVKPSLSLQNRQLVTQANRPTVFLGCDWLDRNASHNISRVYYSTKPCHKLAQIVCESLEDWGHRYVFGHKVSKPIYDSKICKGDAIRISPFALNGPGADVYLTRLKELGETLGLSVMLWLNEQKMGRIRYG